MLGVWHTMWCHISSGAGAHVYDEYGIPRPTWPLRSTNNRKTCRRVRALAPTTREIQHHTSIDVYQESWRTPQKWPICVNTR